MVNEKIRALSLLIGEIQTPKAKGVHASSSYSVGIPKGALIELTGHAKTEWLLSFLSENSKLKVFWVESKISIFPTAVHQRGASLENIIFAENSSDLFKTIRKAIRSKVFPVVVMPSDFGDDKTLRALQLVTEKANAVVFMLAKTRHSNWPISIQLDISLNDGSKEFEIKTLKNKYFNGGA